MENDDPQPPLDYRNYSDDRSERRRNISSLISGIVVGIVAVGFFGLSMAIVPAQHVHSTTRPISNSPMIFAFACGAVVAGILAFLTLRASNRRFALAGFLIGAAVTCLLEGICFSL